MKKNKMAKLLLSLGIGVVTAFSFVAVSGCTTENGEEHTHDYKYVQDGENGHHQECKGCDDKKATEAHNYGEDNVCDNCGYEKNGTVEHQHDYEYVQDGEEGHHQACKGCDDVKATEAHNYGEDNVCDNCGYEKNGTVEHQHDYEYVQDGALGHHQACKGCDDVKPTEDHDYGEDNVCDNCGYEKQATPSQSVKHELVVPEKGKEWTENTLMEDGFFTILSTSGKKAKTESIKENNTGYNKNGKELTFSGSQFSLTAGGVYGSKVWQAGLMFTTTETCKVTIYVAAKSDKDVALVVYNYVELPDADGTVVPEKATPSNMTMDGEAITAFENLTKDANNNTVVEYVFELPAGSYALGGTTGGLFVYGLIVEVGI